MAVNILQYPPNNNPCGSAWDNGVLPPNAKVDTYCTQENYYSVDRKRILGGLMNEVSPILQAQIGICEVNEYLGGAGTSIAANWYFAIQVITDTTLNVGVGQTAEINGALNTAVDLTPLSAKVLPAGTILYGNFSKVVLVSGLVKLMGHPLK